MKKITFSLFLLSFSAVVFAQEQFASAHIKAYQPLANFSNNIDGVPVGLSFSFLSGLKNSPLYVGFEGGIANYNCSETTIMHKGQEIEIMEEDGFLNFHGLVRYNLVDGKWGAVYGEGKVGIVSFFSSTSAVDCESGYDPTFKLHGTAVNLGFGGGVLINPTIFADFDENSPIMIDLGVNSYRGSTSRYSINSEEVPGSASTRESFTNYIDYKIGVIVKL